MYNYVWLSVNPKVFDYILYLLKNFQVFNYLSFLLQTEGYFSSLPEKQSRLTAEFIIWGSFPGSLVDYTRFFKKNHYL